MTKLQELIIQKIAQTRDEGLLQEISRLLETGKEEEVYQLNVDHISLLEEAREQISKGSFVSNEESERKTREWLRKK